MLQSHSNSDKKYNSNSNSNDNENNNNEASIDESKRNENQSNYHNNKNPKQNLMEKIPKSQIKQFYRPDILDLTRIYFLGNLISNVNFYCYFSYVQMSKKNQWKMIKLEKLTNSFKKIMIK